MNTAFRQFPTIPSSSVLLQTRDLEICQGVLTSISSDSWTYVRDEIQILEVTDSRPGVCIFLRCRVLISDHAPSSASAVRETINSQKDHVKNAPSMPRMKTTSTPAYSAFHGRGSRGRGGHLFGMRVNRECSRRLSPVQILTSVVS